MKCTPVRTNFISATQCFVWSRLNSLKVAQALLFKYIIENRIDASPQSSQRSIESHFCVFSKHQDRLGSLVEFWRPEWKFYRGGHSADKNNARDATLYARSFIVLIYASSFPRMRPAISCLDYFEVNRILSSEILFFQMSSIAKIIIPYSERLGCSFFTLTWFTVWRNSATDTSESLFILSSIWWVSRTLTW